MTFVIYLKNGAKLINEKRKITWSKKYINQSDHLSKTKIKAKAERAIIMV